ncbi:DUF4328 domain-containing protein [Kitasatospora sp. NPDC001261]|uniref:DUF4328 domain-containing protein n=1 Tax=Kitasatospora sp. NPDC001261 TaxID=3364012 RepID=UPI0036814CA1
MPSPALYRSPRPSSTAATVLLAVCGTATLASLAAGFRLYGEAGEFAADSDLADDSALTDAALLYDNVSLVQTLTLLASAVAFITWFHRVRVNAEVFDPSGHRFKRGWAIGGWFTPVVALWFPFRITVDTWTASARPDASGVRLPHPQPLVNLWWATFWLANATGRFGANYLNSAKYPDDYQTALGWLLVSDVLEVVAAVFAVLVVQRLTAMQEERFAESTAHAYAVRGGTVRG